jgi:hypothetical protein
MKIINFDATMLNTIQNCFRKAQYSLIYNLTPHEREESLEKGDLIHKMLEVYYSMLGPQDYDTTVWKELKQAGIDPEGNPGERAIEAGIYSTKLQIPLDVSEEVIKHFKDYIEYYRYDEWHPLHVEEVGSKVIYESQDLQMIYNYKIDLIAEKGNIIAPFDHKSGRHRRDPSSISNQFIGYCYALDTNYIVMNKIGFQKTLAPSERFQRFIFNIDDNRIKEWRANAIWWMRLYSECIEDDIYPMNLTSCDKYSGCIFRKICEADPENRDYKMARDFSTVERWDVAKTLEVK